MFRHFFFFAFSVYCCSCVQHNNPLEKVIQENQFLKNLAANPDYEAQIIYSQIDRDSLQNPVFTTFSYQVDSSKYFYPASTVKLPASLLALEKINRLNIAGFDKYSKMETDSAFSRQSRVLTDSTAPGMSASIGHYIRKILITSDNDAFNRLYEFLGPDYFNNTLREKGYLRSRIIHRLSLSRTPEENLHTNPVRFFHGDSVVYGQPLVKSSGKFYSEIPILRGKGYEKEGKIINEPFDFRYKNFFPLDEQHQLLKALFFPEQFPENSFQLNPSDYDFLYQNMGILPGESDIAVYQNKEEYWDSFVKFFMFGSDPSAKIPPNIRIFNKIGLAYGYVIDNAYIVDFENNVEFMLSAVIHVNKNRIFNDGVYEYDSLGFPFMAQLGQQIYQLELKRNKRVKPDLSNLQLLFEE